MKSAIKNILFFIAAFLIIDFIFYKSRSHFGGWRFYHFFEMLAYFTVFFLFILSLLYNKAFKFKSSSLKVTAVLLFSFIASYHLTGRLMAINNDYYFSKNVSWDVTPGLWKFDKELGYKGTPNTSGSYNYFIGDSITCRIPVLFDSQGYRSAPADLRLVSGNKDLFLGCSWTFGDLVNAENTYPYLIAKGLGHSYINTGASGYGTAQMYRLANKLIPQNHFTYTFIQLSPWLADRATDMAGPSSFGYWPFPYFSRDKDGKFEMNSLAFGVWGTYEHNWHDTKITYADKMSFWLRPGFSIEMVDYYAYKFAKFKALMGIVPKPAKEKRELEVYFYKYIADLCKANNSIPVIVKFGYKYPVDEDAAPVIKALSGVARIIDLDSATHELVKGGTDLQYSKLFHIWYVTKGGDSVFVNGHPGAYAHKVFADKVISVLKNQ